LLFHCPIAFSKADFDVVERLDSLKLYVTWIFPSVGFGALMRRISAMFDGGMHSWPIMEFAINALVSNNNVETLVSWRNCRRVNILDLPLE
jgi:hypothetical protein